MSPLDPSQRELAALGAALGSNCVPCVEYHIPEARRAGLSDAQIAEAIRVADKVRKVPAQKVLDVALQMLGDAPSASEAADASPCQGVAVPKPSAGGCGCG